MNDDRDLMNTPEAAPSEEPTAGGVELLSEEATMADGPSAEPTFDDMAEAPESDGATLVVKRNGAETAEVFPIHSPAVIGRFDPAVGPVDVDLGPLPEGVYVSRKHAVIQFADGEWTIEDLGSSNGTFLLQDGAFERVECAPIGDGTEIALGNARFVFHM